MLKKSIFYKNLGMSILSQGVAYGLSFLLTLVVPKFISVEDFGYWQLFSLYSSYSALFLLGCNDGALLRLGGKDYKKLNYNSLSGQFRTVVCSQLFISALLLFFALFFIQEDNARQFVWVMFALYVPVFNSFTYLSYIFQAVNRTSVYSAATLIWKITFIAYISLIFLLLMVRSSESLISAYLVCAFFGLLFVLYRGKSIVFAKPLGFIESVKTLKSDIVVGFKLSLAYYCSALILGLARIIVDSRWGITEFSMFSFSVSMLQIMLALVASVSVVLFPALKTMSREKYKKVYKKGCELVGILMPSIYFLVPLLSLFIGSYLPNYSNSINYLTILIIVCACDTKNNFLNVTFLKALRKENAILIINVTTFLLSAFFIFFFGDKAENIAAIVSICVLSRCVISEVLTTRILGTSPFPFVIIEILSTMFYLVLIFLNQLYLAYFVIIIWLFYSIARFFLVLNIKKKR